MTYQTTWGEKQIHAAAWKKAHTTGWEAYQAFKAEGCEEQDCVAGAIAAGVMEYTATARELRADDGQTPPKEAERSEAIKE
jgi:hypothetical protein